MKKRLLILILLSKGIIMLNGVEAFAQKQGQEKIDSLFSVLKITKEDSSKVNTLNDIAYEFSSTNPDTAIYFANEALALASTVNYKMGIADAYNLIGTSIINLGEYDEALKNLNKAIKLFDQLIALAIGIEKKTEKSKILKQKAGTFNNIGNIYLIQSNYSEALKGYFISLKIREEIGDKQGIASSYNNIGLIYNEQGNYPEALKSHIASLKIKEEIGNKQGIAGSYNNIGLIYDNQDNYSEALKNYIASSKIYEEIGNKKGLSSSYNNIGVIYRKQGNYPEALKNYFASLKISEAIGNKLTLAYSYGNLGFLYYIQSNYREALKYNFALLKISEEIGNKKGLAGAYNNIGIINLKQKRNNEASLYLNKGLSLAKEISSLNDLKESYSGLTALDSTQNNFKQAFVHFKMYIKYRDSLFSKENTKKMMQSQMQYKFDKKESLAKAEQDKKDVIALKELQKQKLLRNGFTGGFAIVLLFAGVFFTQRNKISKGKKLSDELLLNILPSEVAEELKQKGNAEAKQFDEVTVIFTDFKDFTKISERLSPAELVAEIDTCFKAFDNITEKYHIEKIKTIGDSYMAAGGLPVPNKTNATDVVNAALEIQLFMNEHKKQKMNEKKEIFEIRIGIHTGPVVAGIVGIKKYSYDIWGDTVNIASRMESSGETGKVNISGATHDLVKDKFNCFYRGKMEAKNKGMIDMYFVTNPII